MQIRAAVLALPPIFPDLKCLADEDEERDFFVNVLHMQTSRQIKTLGQLRLLLETQAQDTPESKDDQTGGDSKQDKEAAGSAITKQQTV